VSTFLFIALGVNMSFFDRFFVTKKRKEKIAEFAKLLNEVKRISSVYECGLAMKALIKFREGLKRNDPLLVMVGQLAEFIIDTRDHARDGYHRSSKTDWKIKNSYPDINQYLKLGYRIKKY